MDIYGTIMFKIKNPTKTATLRKIPIINGIFIHLKGGYFTLFTEMFSDVKYLGVEDAYGREKQMKYTKQRIEDFVYTYFSGEYYKTVEPVLLKAESPIMQALLLKFMNVLPKNSKMGKYFEREYSIKTMYYALSKLLKKYYEYKVAELIAHKYKNPIPLSPFELKLTELGLKHADKFEGNVLDLRKHKNLYKLTVNTDVPVYSEHVIDTLKGILYFFGVNNEGYYIYNPPATKKIIIGEFKMKPKYTAPIVSIGEYLTKYKPKRARGIVPEVNVTFSFTNPEPIMCHNPFNDKVYFLAKTRFDEPVIVEVPLKAIKPNSSYSATRVVYNGKEYPVSGIKFYHIIAKTFIIERKKINGKLGIQLPGWENNNDE